MKTLTHAEYARIQRVGTVITLGANLLGALITFFYLSAVAPIPQDSSPVLDVPLFSTFVSLMAIVFLLFLGNYVGGMSQKHYPKWARHLLDGGEITRVPRDAQREVLQYPAAVALVSLSMWFVAGFFFGFLLTGAWEALFGVFGVGGVITSAIVYFSINALWRPVVWLFFSDGRTGDVPAWRNSVQWRLVLGFVLVGFYPAALLSLTSVSRAQALLNSENPQVILQNLYIALGVISLIAVLAGVALAVLVSRSVVSPLLRLQSAMGKVAQNDLNVHLLADTNDELGYVSQGFNDMVAGLRRAEMLRNLLNLYVSPEVARAALEGGTNLGGQVVNCTILFSDIRGFTSLSEKLPPDQLISLLNRYMSRMVDVVIANGGIVNKFGGDSLLAIFGTPLNPDTDHAARAIRSALAMQSTLREFNLEQVALSQPELRIGIGIATGPAVAGNIGGEDRVEYTVIGDTVNLASRLQDLTKELKRDILINAAAFEQAQPHNAEALAPVAVRGKAELVSVYSICE
jgi:adenylate cyclase